MDVGDLSTSDGAMPDAISLYPLRFEPIFQYRLWGGRRLEDWLDAKLPDDEPIGEAWLLSDRDDFPSRVADGPFKGQTLTELIERSPNLMLGELASQYRKFPLLLKFLDVQKMLSVQVHPPDNRTDLIPAGESGKTEPRLRLRLTHEEIAQMIGTSRETVTRLFAELKKRQILQSKGSTLVIRNTTALRDIANHN